MYKDMYVYMYKNTLIGNIRMSDEKINISTLMGGKRRTKEKFAEDFAINEEAIEQSFSEEIKQPNNIIQKPKASNSIQSQLELKKKYTLTLKPATMEKLEFLEKIIKDGQTNRRIGGLKSKLIDYIIEEYFDDFISSIEGDK